MEIKLKQITLLILIVIKNKTDIYGNLSLLNWKIIKTEINNMLTIYLNQHLYWNVLGQYYTPKEFLH